MKVLILFALGLGAVALAAPSPGTSPARMLDVSDSEIAVDNVLTKRACVKNGCKCRKKTKQGQYCGNCDHKPSGGYIVLDLGKNGATNHIYECNPNGGCCDYGKRKGCVQVSPKICG